MSDTPPSAEELATIRFRELEAECATPTGWITSHTAANIVRKAFNAGWQARQPEIDDRIAQYGHLITSIKREVEAARREGMEAAAKWHEDQAGMWELTNQDEVNARVHRQCAEAIRKSGGPSE